MTDPDAPSPLARIAEIEHRQDRLLAELDRLNGEIERALEGLDGSGAAA